MKYIRSCSNCKTELKFPIDEGAIRVICPKCGASFIVDPDKPETFLSGSFELPSAPTTLKRKLTESISDILYLPIDFIKFYMSRWKTSYHPIQFAKIILFILLGLYVLRGCHSDQSTVPLHPKQNIPQQEAPPALENEPSYQI